jgi:hypothetical protein
MSNNLLPINRKYARGRKETVNGNFQEDFQLLNYNPGENPLIEDIRKWGTWIFGQVKDELAKFYPNDKDGSIPVGNITLISNLVLRISARPSYYSEHNGTN